MCEKCGFTAQTKWDFEVSLEIPISGILVNSQFLMTLTDLFSFFIELPTGSVEHSHWIWTKKPRLDDKIHF